MSVDLEALAALMPFAGQLGLVLDEAGPDRVIARLAWAPHLCTSGGIMHGGVLMSLADTAGALVAFLGLPEGATTATITSTSQMFRPVGSGIVRAVAVPLHRGRTMVTAQTSVYDSGQRLVALTTQIQAVRPAPASDHADPGSPAGARLTTQIQAVRPAPASDHADPGRPAGARLGGAGLSGAS